MTDNEAILIDVIRLLVRLLGPGSTKLILESAEGSEFASLMISVGQWPEVKAIMETTLAQDVKAAALQV